MGIINATNYNFLKNFRPELYKLALKMEEDLLITPISMLAYATRFLEYILYDVARLNKYDVNREVGFVNNIYILIEQGFIEFNFGDLLIKAYVFRNQSIHNIDITKSLKNDKKTALELNRRLFDIADIYYKNITNNHEKHTYSDPKIVEESNESKTIIKQEKLFDRCIICGNDNKLTKSNFCQDCDNLLNYREVISKIIAEKGKHVLLKDNDFDYAFKKQLINDLISKNILEKIGNNYNFVNENLDNYFKITDEFMEIDEYLVDFYYNAVENPRDSKFYKNDAYPYREVSKIIDEFYVRQLLRLYEQGFSLEYCFEHVDVNEQDLKIWYDDKKSEFSDGNKNVLFIKYNELLIKDLFRSIEKNGELNVSQETINFWAENFEGFSDKLSNKLSKWNLTLFMKLFKMNNTKEYVLNQLNISNEDFDKYLTVHKILADEYFEEVEKRKGYVLVHIKELGLNESLKKAKLDYADFKKEKSHYFNGQKNKFYQKLTEILQERYLNCRKDGLSTLEICEILEIDENEIKMWFKDKSFEKEYEKIRLDLFKKAINGNKSKQEILDCLEISEIELDNFIDLGESGDLMYAAYADYFQNDYYPQLIRQFLDEFREKSNLSVALNNLNMSKDDLINCIYSDEELYQEFIDIKIEKIVTTLINKGKINKKLLNRLDLSKNDYAKYENRINQKVQDKQLEFISCEIYKGDIVFRACKKVNCDMGLVFDWIYKGSVGDEHFEQLADFYWEEHIHLINEGNSEIRDGVPVKALIKNLVPVQLKYDFEYWKKWGLIDKKNVKLTIDDIKKILKGEKNDF